MAASLSTDPIPPDPAHRREREHLAASRAALRRMRERTQSLEAQGGNAVSTEYLKAALWRRAQSLLDDPLTALFFGRIDYAEPAERFYVGRRHVQDESGEPLVVDWRASISRPFYRASREAPLGIRRRRRFGVVRGELTAYEDEVFDPATPQPVAGSDHRPVDRPDQAAVRPTASAGLASDIVRAEIERPRVGPMRDIVATIQPDQDVLVRADLDRTICVQGAPGTGKTAVGLHRAAYLLYAYRERLQRSGVLVVGPNRSFLRYIGDVLPALGEIDAQQTTVDDLLGSVEVRSTDPPAVAMLKGDPRLAELLHRAVWSHLTPPVEPMILLRGSRRFRVGLVDLDEAVRGLRQREVRYGAGRALLHQRIAHAVLVQMEAAGEAPDDRVQDAVARSRPVRACVDAIWPAVDPVRLVFRLLTDPDWLASVADGILDPTEAQLLLWTPRPRSVTRAPWTAADAVLVDEVADLIERTGSVGHVVLDEAQDLSPMQLRAVGRRCSTGSATLLGDLAQGTTPWAATSWPAAARHLGKPDAEVDELTVGFRVPADLIAYAVRILPAIAPDLAPPTSVRGASGGLSVVATAELVAGAVAEARQAMSRAGSVAVVVPDSLVGSIGSGLRAAGLPTVVLGDPDDVDARLEVVPASLVKGLEFDHVVLVEPAAIVDAEPDRRTGLRRLYVALTRAVTTLTVVHRAPLPAELAD